MITKNKKLGFLKRNQTIIGFLMFGISIAVGTSKILSSLPQNQLFLENFSFIVNIPDWFSALLFILGLLIGIGGLDNE